MPRCAVALKSRFQNGMAWHGVCESNTAALRKLNGKDTILTLSGTAWECHGVCELALRKLSNGLDINTITFVSG
jgi:hypothetical protein